MKKTKIEEYAISNGLLCEITIGIDSVTASLFKEGQLYIKTFTSKTMNEAIEKAVNHHRGVNSASSRRTQVQDEKRVRDIHKRFSKK